MRIAFREGESKAIVTRSSTVDATAKNKAQLECQRSLWKPGDVFVSDLGPTGGTMVVRDWGLTQGVCRHQDTKVPAVFIFEEEDHVILSVVRGRTPITQEWSRVR